MRFNGFEHLTANYLYCPNQFFDVCLPHHSRGTVRLVAYMLRKTLGWLDEEGNPVEQHISVSYRDLINEAGISRGAIRQALDQAVAGKFIDCIQQGKANRSNQAAETACYSLRWAPENHYVKTPETFNGFFGGEGYRTPIPNSFFDLIVRQERLAVVKVVGTVLRHTVGYQNQFGGRRQIAPLSYSYILKYVNLSDRSTLSAAIRHAIETGYIRCVRKGGFDPSNSRRRPSTYAIRWDEQANSDPNGSKTRPVTQQRYKNQTSNGSETKPAERFKNQTKEKPQLNNTSKQQHETSVAAENIDAFLILIDAGFDKATAKELSESRGFDEIQQQIEWLDQRNPRDNRLGMLRKAIEQNWAKPVSVEQAEKKLHHAEQARQQATQQEVDDEKAAEAKQERKRCRKAALVIFNSMIDEQRTAIENGAFEHLNSDFFRQRFRTDKEFHLHQCLDEICRREGTIPVTSSAT